MKKEKLREFAKKTHINFLILAILIYALKGPTYFLIAKIPVEVHTFDMAIDRYIPFIKYFYVFYFSYYIVPEIFMWLLSWYDRKKFYTILFTFLLSSAIACVCFVVYQVQMIRQPGYPMDMTLSDIHSISDFFDFAVSFQYKADADALNCFPSLHAAGGTILFLLGLDVNDHSNFPKWMRIFCMVDGIGIICSTVFIKQHYFIDVVAGVVLAVGVFFLVRHLVNKFLEKKNIVFVNEK